MSDETPAESASPTDLLRDRRTVLRGAAVAGLAGVGVPLLAACGDDSAGSAAPTAPSTSTPPTSAPSSQAPSTTAASPSTGGGAVLGASADIPVGGGKVFPDAKIVVTQPTAGKFNGFSAVCTHAGCVVSKVEGDTIDCACHGSQFKASDGSVVTGPAREPLAAVAVTVKDGKILGPAG